MLKAEKWAFEPKKTISIQVVEYGGMVSEDICQGREGRAPGFSRPVAKKYRYYRSIDQTSEMQGIGFTCN